MNGDDRPTPRRGWRCSRPCSAPSVAADAARRVRGDPGRRARDRRPRRPGPQPAPGRARRGAHRPLCSRAAPARPRSAASDASCSTASGPRSTPTTSRSSGDGAAEAYDCKWGARGINADVLHQLDDARTHADDEDERCASGWSSSTPSARAGSASSARPPRRARPTSSPSRRSIGWRAPRGEPVERRASRRRSGSASTRPRPDGRVRTSALLRYAQDLAWQHSDALGFDRAWYAGRGRDLARPGGRAGRPRPDAQRRRRSPARPRSSAGDACGPVAGPSSTTRTAPLTAWVHIDWVLLDGRGAPQRIPADFQAAFGVPTATFPLGPGRPRRRAGRRRGAARSRSGPRSSTRSTTSTTRSTPTGSTSRSWPPAATPGSGGHARAAAPGPPRVRPRRRARRDGPGHDLAGRGRRAGRAASTTRTAPPCCGPGSSRAD